MPFIIQWVDACTGAEEIASVDTPVGQLILSSRQGVIYQVDWAQAHDVLHPPPAFHWDELSRYWLNPEIRVPLKLLKQGSVYRHQVWAALTHIPIGTTLSYSALAKNIGSSARAVGNACRDNPYPLFIPCHRVVSLAGLGGYHGHTEGDFMTLKRNLLNFEAAYKR
jgi:methylated-DNA-[protein]-cysteine S-methyltransferase